MRNRNFRERLSPIGLGLVLVGTLIGSWGCSLEKQGTPNLTGPSDSGISVELEATPDILNADGVSQSIVRMVLRDQNGRPFSGRSVLFGHDGDGFISPWPGSLFVGPVQTGLVMASDQNGEARVVYTAGTAITTVTFFVKPYGIDTTFTFFKSVELHQQ